MNKKPISAKERIIFALDVANQETAQALVERLCGHCSFFKVGLQLFFAAGWPMVDYIRNRGAQVMLDLKLHDIPETVRLALGQFAGRGLHFTTVHAMTPVMEAALAAQTEVGILAVTLLTSQGGEPSGCLTVEELVLSRAREALRLGCAGVVCSAREAALLRRVLGQEFYIVSPGIRPGGVARHDQARVATPREAILAGVDYLVIGRPIRDAADPLACIEAIEEEIESALVETAHHQLY